MNSICLCLILKNANLYILKIIEYYKQIGINKIFIHDVNNKNGESFDFILSNYIKSNFVEIINCRGIANNYNIYEMKNKLQLDFYNKFYDQYDYICFVPDILQFNINNHNSIFEYIKDNLNKDVIQIRNSSNFIIKSNDKYKDIEIFNNLFNKENIIQNKKDDLKVAICAIAKNENLYIREWVEWYKNLGVSKIFLYDNNELDGERFEEVINDYIESGFVEVSDVRGVEKGCVYDEEGINLQPKCYIDCYENKVKDFDWVCFFDIDEFLNFKNDLNLFKFLNDEKFNDTDTILVSWEHYDDNGLYDYDIRNVVDRFNHKSKIKFHGVKSIVRTNKQIYDKKIENLIHCFKLVNFKIKFSNGIQILKNNLHNWYSLTDENHNKCNVVLNHYKTKTITEYLLRHLNRHWGTGKKYTDHIKTIENCYNDFFLYNDKSKIKEEIINNFNYNACLNNISYYKKLKNIKINLYIKKYNDYISKLELKNNFISKKLNKEIGIISLTTWKARINNVYITLCNLLDMCPNFHIVLVLSEEEFPNKENELPIEIKKLISNELIEIIWTPNNYKTCKKLIFTIEKYYKYKLPIITADDDCLYITNYAQELYNKYKQNNNYVIRYNMYNINKFWQYSQGPCTLYNPIVFKYFLRNKEMFLDNKMLYKDDQIITKICKENKILISYIYRGHIFPFIFINELLATNNNIKNIDFANCYV